MQYFTLNIKEKTQICIICQYFNPVLQQFSQSMADTQNYVQLDDDLIPEGKPDTSSPYQSPTGPIMLSQTLYGSARLQFVRKVYTILTIQLLITAAMCVIAIEVPGFLEFQLNNQWLMWLCFAFFIISEIVVLCLPIGRKFPANIIGLLVFTLSFAYIISYVCSYTAESNGKLVVLIAGVSTLAITIACTLYAMFSKTDFSIKWGFVIVIFTTMSFLGIFSIFYHDRFLVILYSSLGVLLFGVYLIIETQLIIGGRRLQFSVDDYIVAALLLYIDIVQIFLYILAMLKK